jgi:uncharacterized protein YjiS (DUF1127 family)
LYRDKSVEEEMMTMTNLSLAGSARTPASFLETIFGDLRSVTRKGLHLLLLWQDRAQQRRALAALEAHHLADIGISRAAARGEIGKPFWRA